MDNLYICPVLLVPYTVENPPVLLRDCHHTISREGAKFIRQATNPVCLKCQTPIPTGPVRTDFDTLFQFVGRREYLIYLREKIIMELDSKIFRNFYIKGSKVLGSFLEAVGTVGQLFFKTSIIPSVLLVVGGSVTSLSRIIQFVNKLLKEDGFMELVQEHNAMQFIYAESIHFIDQVQERLTKTEILQFTCSVGQLLVNVNKLLNCPLDEICKMEKQIPKIVAKAFGILKVVTFVTDLAYYCKELSDLEKEKQELISSVTYLRSINHSTNDQPNVTQQVANNN